MAKLVISLDFELFWGVSNSRTMRNYGSNIEGVWKAVPEMLELFSRFDVHVTWATVGMLMCRNYDHWSDMRPILEPYYRRSSCSTYRLDELVKNNPKLFFARPLVDNILSIGGHELATHTYSHFYCGEEGVTPQQFSADLNCANEIASEMGVAFRSIVFPRNQVKHEYLKMLPSAGIKVYRGNPDNWLYRDGHFAPGGSVGRVVRFLDAWLPLTGDHSSHVAIDGELINVPASLFLRPWSRRFSLLESLRLHRLKNAMTVAAQTGRVCHLWWHPHNFGVNLENNLAALKNLLEHYRHLKDLYGMKSVVMSDFESVGK